MSETARNLRRLGIFRLVRIDSAMSDTGLIVRVTTQDGWSTQPEFAFRSTGGQVAWRVSLVEENFLGSASSLLLGYTKDPDPVAEGWPLPESWGGYSQHSVDTLPLPTRHLTAGEVLRFRDGAFQTYFQSEGYLRAVERRFGPAVREEIQQMSTHRLERRYGS